MKRFVRLFLLFIFSLLSEYGLHACSHKNDNGNDHLARYTTTNDNISLYKNEPHHFSQPGAVKKEFRKTRGTNEEDDDEKIFVVKKTRSFPLSLKPNNNIFGQPIASNACTASNSQAIPYSSAGFFYLHNNKRYSFFQVFRI